MQLPQFADVVTCGGVFGAIVKTRKYYLERAAHMRELADDAQTPFLRAGCLKAAEAYEILAEMSGAIPERQEDPE